MSHYRLVQRNTGHVLAVSLPVGEKLLTEDPDVGEILQLCESYARLHAVKHPYVCTVFFDFYDLYSGLELC